MLIDFLNSRNRRQLEELEIEDITATIIGIKKVLTKRSLMLNLEKRCQSIQADINSFMLKYVILREKGLPSPMVIHDKLMTQDDYIKKLEKQAKSQVGSSAVKELST